MHTEQRNGAASIIVVHVNVGPEIEGGAQELANYLRSIDGGYHEVVDDKTAIVTASDNILVWGAGGVNERGWHICIIGSADQTPQQWADAYSLGELDIAAYRVAQACKRLIIPVAKLQPSEVARNGTRGICGHLDVSAVFAESQGHYDPGHAFPWDQFIGLVQHFLSPNVVPEDDDVPKPTDITASLANEWGEWDMTADGGIRTRSEANDYFGSYPGLSAKYHEKPRWFNVLRNRDDGKPGYMQIANDGSRYRWGPETRPH